jgi:peptidoglycan hydrolase-like protein with peptidoglycan-binding domain
MQATTRALYGRVGLAAVLLATTLVLGMSFAGSAVASTAYSAASAEPAPIPWTGWHGRPIERPHKPVDVKALTTSVDYPAGWSAGAVKEGSGYNQPNGSKRVREVQRRLTRLGYHTGPIDGLFGPLTRSAVQWFQIKHGLRPTGVVAATTLAALHNPGVLASTRGKPQVAPTRQPLPAPVAQPSSGGLPRWVIPVVFGLLGLMLLAVSIVGLLVRSNGRRAQRRLLPPALTANTALFRVAPDADGPVLGYVRSNDVESAMAHTAAIMDACEEHGWMLERLIRDTAPTSKSRLEQPGLSYALEELRKGEASRLVVHELDQLAMSGTELRMMLGWFLRTGVALSALDVGLDTSTEEGRDAAAELLAAGRRESPAGDVESRRRVSVQSAFGYRKTEGVGTGS